MCFPNFVSIINLFFFFFFFVCLFLLLLLFQTFNKGTPPNVSQSPLKILKKFCSSWLDFLKYCKLNNEVWKLDHFILKVFIFKCHVVSKEPWEKSYSFQNLKVNLYPNIRCTLLSCNIYQKNGLLFV